MEALFRKLAGDPRVSSATSAPPDRPGTESDEVLAFLERYLVEPAPPSLPWNREPKTDDYAAGREILALDQAGQVAIVLAAARRLLFILQTDVFGWSTDEDAHRRKLDRLISHLLRRRPLFSSQDVRYLLSLLVWGSTSDSGRRVWARWFPLRPIARAVLRHVEQHGLSQTVRVQLVELAAAGTKHTAYTDERKLLDEIHDVLNAVPGDALRIDETDPWGRRALDALTAMAESEQSAWKKLLVYCATANNATPSRRWLKGAKQAIAESGEKAFKERAIAWLGLIGSRPLRQDDGGVPLGQIPDRNSRILRGLAWCCSLFDDEAIARALGDAAVGCFFKIPGFGARSHMAGNACVYALGAMPGMRGVVHLQRLQARVKYGEAQRLIGKAFDEAARRAGLSREDMEELAVPGFGLVDGRFRQAFGEYTGEVVVTGPHEVDVVWVGAGEKTFKGVPAAVKRDFAAELKEFKHTAGELRKTLPGQRDRIERLFLMERAWSFTDWRERFLDHPLLSVMARRLIWRFDDSNQSALAAWLHGNLVDVSERSIGSVSPQARVSLWHPLDADPQTVLAWRRWLERHEVVQPFKQAHREVYLLTDAERQTRVYSNRFAAHILRQHQLQALCQQRGWSYHLQGTSFDAFNNPARALPQHGVTAEFWVEPLEAGGSTGASISLYVGTDQVRFYRTNRMDPVALEDLSARLFSEVMRDVDLFVGVCSIGNDPNWADRGPDHFGAYWQQYSFGELLPSAQTRREVLERIIPRLKIADRCSFADRFLVVRGDLRTYRIHLGSGNILMEPNDQYLCIVPGRGTDHPGDRRVFLPFEGDQILSIVLSKAFLLANDRAIKDPTIVSQIRRSS